MLWCKPGDWRVQCKQLAQLGIFGPKSSARLIAREFSAALRQNSEDLGSQIARQLEKWVPIAEIARWDHKDQWMAVTPLRWEAFGYLGNEWKDPYLRCTGQYVRFVELLGKWRPSPVTWEPSPGRNQTVHKVLGLNVIGWRELEAEDYQKIERSRGHLCRNGYNPPQIFLDTRWRKAKVIP